MLKASLKIYFLHLLSSLKITSLPFADIIKYKVS